MNNTAPIDAALKRMYPEIPECEHSTQVFNGYVWRCKDCRKVFKG